MEKSVRNHIVWQASRQSNPEYRMSKSWKPSKCQHHVKYLDGHIVSQPPCTASRFRKVDNYSSYQHILFISAPFRGSRSRGRGRGKSRLVSARSIRKATRQYEWATCIKLTDAYFHILVHYHFRNYLRFVQFDQTYQFRAMSFNLLVYSPSFCQW